MFYIEQHKPKSLRSWFAESDNIDVDPDYQRRSNIWSRADQQFLIDTIINGFDIPKFYFANFTVVNSSYDSSGKLYAVIDGKQRIETIFKFFRNELSLSRDFVFFEDLTYRLGGMTYQDLQREYSEIARRFDSYIITVMSVVSDTDGERKINEIFIRLNKGVALSGAEKRNARSGPIPVVIRALANHEFFQDKISFDALRGQDLNGAAKLLLIEYKRDLTSTKKNDLDKFVQLADEATSPPVESGTMLFSEELIDNDFRDAFTRSKENLDLMSQVFKDRDRLLRGAGTLPLYYWFVRNQARGRIEFIHSFLSYFENVRSENRNLARGIPSNPRQATFLDISEPYKNIILTAPNSIDEELLSYDLSNRSTDDESSLRLRYNILVKRFEFFLQLLDT